MMLVFWFYTQSPSSPQDSVGAFTILVASWEIEFFDYSHGWLVFPITLWMLIHSWRKIDTTTFRGSKHGLWSICLGGLMFVMAYHIQQWRLTNAGFPFLLFGGIWYFLGRRPAFQCAFPLFFLWLSIPIPGFQHTTTGMQIIATTAAHYVTELCGIPTIQEGTNLTMANETATSFSISGGCSGMRSLMALVMISFAWGYLADKLAIWKRILLALSALPLAIICNCFRVSSIFICAEYINPAFASKTWHDWSGLLFFFPAALLGLVVLHGILAGELPLFKRRRTVTRVITTVNKEKTC